MNAIEIYKKYHKIAANVTITDLMVRASEIRGSTVYRTSFYRWLDDEKRGRMRQNTVAAIEQAIEEMSEPILEAA